MTSKQFTSWLKGYLTGKKSLTRTDKQIIEDELEKVFDIEISCPNPTIRPYVPEPKIPDPFPYVPGIPNQHPIVAMYGCQMAEWKNNPNIKTNTTNDSNSQQQ